MLEGSQKEYTLAEVKDYPEFTFMESLNTEEDGLNSARKNKTSIYPTYICVFYNSDEGGEDGVPYRPVLFGIRNKNENILLPLVKGAEGGSLASLDKLIRIIIEAEQVIVYDAKEFQHCLITACGGNIGVAEYLAQRKNFKDVKAGAFLLNTTRQPKTLFDTYSELLGASVSSEIVFRALPAKDIFINEGLFFAMGKSLEALEKTYLFLTKKIPENARLAFSMDSRATAVLGILEHDEIPINMKRVQKLELNFKRQRNMSNKFLCEIGGKGFNPSSIRDLETLKQRLSVDISEGKTDFEKNLREALDIYRKSSHCLANYITAMTKYSSGNKTIARGRFLYKTTNAQCLPSGNTVLIKGMGFIDIGLVQAGMQINTEYGFKKVLHAKHLKKTNILKIHLENGAVISCTPNHPLLVNTKSDVMNSNSSKTISRQWVEAGCLLKGDTLILQGTSPDNTGEDSFPIRKKDLISILIARSVSIFGRGLQFMAVDDVHIRGVALNERVVCDILSLYGIFPNVSHKQENGYNYTVYRIESYQEALALTNEFLKNIVSIDFMMKLSQIPLNTLQGYRESKIKSIEEAGCSEVYDIEVEDVHEYNANLFITHNTSRILSGKTRKAGFFPISVQSLPKPDKCEWLYFDSEEDFETAIAETKVPTKNIYAEKLLGHVMCKLVHFSDIQMAMSNKSERDIAEKINRESLIYRNKLKKYGKIVSGGDIHSIKSAVCCFSGEVIVGFDYKMEELCLACNLFNEENILKRIIGGEDIYLSLAKEAFVPYNDEYSGTLRSMIKTVIIGILYGMTQNSIAKRINNQLKEHSLDKDIQFCGDVIFSKLHSIIEQQETLVSDKRLSELYKGEIDGKDFYEVLSATGRPRHILCDKSASFRRNNMIKNAPIQTLASDVIRVVLCRIADSFDMEEVHFMSAVHDELNFSVKEDKVIEFIEKFIKILEYPFSELSDKYKNIKNFRLVPGISIGNSVGNMFDFEYCNGALSLISKGE